MKKEIKKIQEELLSREDYNEFKGSDDYADILADLMVDMNERIKKSDYDLDIRKEYIGLWKELCEALEDEEISNSFEEFVRSERIFDSIWKDEENADKPEKTS